MVRMDYALRAGVIAGALAAAGGVASLGARLAF
jgi:hypothetical protein